MKAGIKGMALNIVFGLAGTFSGLFVLSIVFSLSTQTNFLTVFTNSTLVTMAIAIAVVCSLFEPVAIRLGKIIVKAFDKGEALTKE